MSIIVLAEHNNDELKSATLSAINAASNIDDKIDILVVGSECQNVVNTLKKIKIIKKIIVVDDPKYLNSIAEFISPILISLSKDYSHILAAASTFGKNVMPRVAALLDVAQISDIIKIENDDTFVRPIYAGNALATVQSTDTIKVITIRPTSFDPVTFDEGEAEIEN